MTSRIAHARYVSREEAGCIGFDAALDAYLEGGGAEDLLRAAQMVAGSAIELDQERAFIIVELTGAICELADYDDAGRAVRRWFALMGEPGARH
jgi:hypothetical protein